MSLLLVLKLIWFIEGTLDVPVNLIKLLEKYYQKTVQCATDVTVQSTKYDINVLQKGG
mgnify:CR=1 FL=1